MMEFLVSYGLFFAKLITVVIGVLIVLSYFFALAQKESDDRPRLKIKKLNKRYSRYAEIMNDKILNRKELKKFKKEQKTLQAERERNPLRRIFFLDFEGDVKASATESLTEEINALLTIATPQDEVLVRINSGGGMVHAYGLAASQLKRIRDHGIPLTIGIDKIAASGGYMMACVADRIIAAPFAIVGSIGVIAQLPNFHRYLKKHNIDFEQIMAGEYKRTLSLFGENTRKDRQKTQEDVDNIHVLFKNFITEHRPSINIDDVSTGEHWHGIEALKLKLIDQIITTDEYLMTAAAHSDIYMICYKMKRSVTQKLTAGVDALMNKLYNSWNQSALQ